MYPLMIKTAEEIAIMREGGEKLRNIKEELRNRVEKGVSSFELDELANTLIEKSGGRASFKMVPGYHWAICVNVNEGIVHGIPKQEVIFKKGDVVSIDVGLFYKGFHTDTSISCAIGANSNTKAFLSVGKAALKN